MAAASWPWPRRWHCPPARCVFPRGKASGSGCLRLEIATTVAWRSFLALLRKRFLPARVRADLWHWPQVDTLKREQRTLRPAGWRALPPDTTHHQTDLLCRDSGIFDTKPARRACAKRRPARCCCCDYRGCCDYDSTTADCGSRRHAECAPRLREVRYRIGRCRARCCSTNHPGARGGVFAGCLHSQVSAPGFLPASTSR